jgi:FAD/FMN-containing dehydrogenase
MSHEFSRQAFLRGSVGLIAAGAFSAACRTSPHRAPGPPVASNGGGPQDWSALANSISGRVILPDNGDFTGAKNVFNTRFDGTTPAAVIAVASTDDVAKAMVFAAKNGLKVAARSGGHSYIGDSAASGMMVVDLRRLPGGISYDETSTAATIPAGADLDSVQTVLAAHGRLIPTGTCPTVGVAGLTLGGGLGADTRQRGLTCDTLVSADVVLPTGQTVTATSEVHDDLFWALRGGSGGHFGVTTSFTFRTFPAADRDVVTITFPKDAAAQALQGWAHWLSGADRAVWGMVNITQSSSGLRCAVVLATSAGEGATAARDISAAIGVSPMSTTTQTLNHIDFVHYFAGGSDATRPRSIVAGSDIIGQMSGPAASSIVAATSAWTQQGSATAVVESLSGAVGDIDPSGTAFPWRRQAACVQWYTEPPTSSAVGPAQDWLTQAHQAVQAHSVGGYVNYVESGEPATRYFGGNLGRLAAIRRAYDPDTVMYSSVSY